jgi:hypothetical protein
LGPTRLRAGVDIVATLDMGRTIRIVAVFAVLTGLFVLLGATQARTEENGLDRYGYNNAARLFRGPADGVDGKLDGMVWGDPSIAKDYLVMTWSKAWADAVTGGRWTPDAWCTNRWTGDVPGGSGISLACKIVWVGKQLENSPYWQPDGYPAGSEFEVIFDWRWYEARQ